MKPNRFAEEQLAPNLEHLNYMFGYNAITGILYVKNPTKRRKKVGKICGTRNTDGYLRVSINGRFFPVHRLVWAMVHGAWPKEMIDHINGIRTDNRLENLREATRFQNPQNQPISKRNSSGVKGVSWSRHHAKWRVTVTCNGKSNHIGLFSEIIEAKAAVEKARESLHGEFARHA